jgi:hypothetical protein
MTVLRSVHPKKEKLVIQSIEEQDVASDIFNSFEVGHQNMVWGGVARERQSGVKSPSVFFGSASWAPLEEGIFSQLLISKPIVGTEYASAIESRLREAFGHTDSLKELSSKVEEIRRLLETVLSKLSSIETHSPGVFVPIDNFASRPYEVVRPFTVVLAASDEGFEACFYDANISSYGDTENEAIENLREVLLDSFDRLNELKDSELGPGPKRQKEILNALIRRVPV